MFREQALDMTWDGSLGAKWRLETANPNQSTPDRLGLTSTGSIYMQAPLSHIDDILNASIDFQHAVSLTVYFPSILPLRLNQGYI